MSHTLVPARMLCALTLPDWSILFYPLLMLAALTTGMLLRGRQRNPHRLSPLEQLWIGLGAFIGAMLFAKLPFVLLNPAGWRDGSAMFLSGKTILFGLAGGYLGVELAKWRLGITIKTGDTFAVPVAGAIAVGRLACFVGSCCYGTPTSLPWAVVFPRVDLEPRHPTQLYEFLFHGLAGLVLSILQANGRFRDQLIKLYFISYCVYRIASEFIRPEARIFAGLTAYQWASLILIGLFAWLWRRDATTHALRDVGDHLANTN